MSRLIVDGNNVMGARPRTRWWTRRAAAAAELVEQLRALGLEADGLEVVVVFDGGPVDLDASHSSGVTVLFAGLSGRSADELIVELAAEPRSAEALSVVTSDRELGRAVAALGASVEGAGAFLERVGLAERR